MRLKIYIHRDGADYWCSVAELPGCFASGRTLNELRESVAEAVGLYLWDAPAAAIEPVELRVGSGEIEVQRS